jgi:beta-galactosidase/beta-glucuronidase
MADSYLSIAEVASDSNMQRRVASCAAQQQLQGAPIPVPETWTVQNRYQWAASPSWGEKWDYARATHPDDPDYQPGADAAVITDGDILATVQSLAPIGG